MKKLVILASLIVVAICFSCCKQEVKNNNQSTETTDQSAICPMHDAMAIFNIKDSIATLIKEAISDKTITDEEASCINNAFIKFQNIDAEIKTKYQENKEAKDKLFSIINAENNYNKSMKLASETEGYEKISPKVK